VRPIAPMQKHTLPPSMPRSKRNLSPICLQSIQESSSLGRISVQEPLFASLSRFKAGQEVLSHLELNLAPKVQIQLFPNGKVHHCEIASLSCAKPGHFKLVLRGLLRLQH
jgi:hypothetical protein